MKQINPITKYFVELSIEQSPKEAWHDYFAQGLLSEVLKGVEEELHGDQNNAQLKLLWVLSHSVLGDVPVSALSTPLEEIRSKGIDDKLFPLAAGTYYSVAIALQERKQSKIALTIIESAVDYAARSGVANEENIQVLENKYLDICNEEIERAEKRREPKAYLLSLTEKKNQLQGRKKEKKVEAAPKSSKSPGFTSKAILEAAYEEDKTKEYTLGLNSQPVIDTEATAATESKPKVVTVSFGKRSAYAAGLVLLLGVGYLVLQPNPQLPLQSSVGTQVSTSPVVNADNAVPINTAPNSAAATNTPINTAGPAPEVPPQVANNVSTAGDTTLGQLQERLNSIDVKSKVEGTSNPANNQNTQTPAPVAEMPSNVESPMTNDQIVRYGSGNQNKDVNSAALPPMDDSIASGIQTEDLGGSLGQMQVGPVAKASDGRVYGNAPVTNSAGAVQGLDGKSVQPREVVPFVPPKVYTTIAKTKVLSSPSIVSTQVDQLDEGAKVQVVADLGRWLELRSHQGLKGYIYSQDAVPSQ